MSVPQKRDSVFPPSTPRSRTPLSLVFCPRDRSWVNVNMMSTIVSRDSRVGVKAEIRTGTQKKDCVF